MTKTVGRAVAAVPSHSFAREPNPISLRTILSTPKSPCSIHRQELAETILGTVHGRRARRRAIFIPFPWPSITIAARNPKDTLSMTEPATQMKVFLITAGNSSMARIFRKFSRPVNSVSKEGRVTFENANETVRTTGTIIIKRTTRAQGTTNSIPVLALF